MASACVYIECPITGMILAVSRKDNHDDFGLPGGKVEPGESERWAAARELLEETGVYIDQESPLPELFRREGGVTFAANFWKICGGPHLRKEKETGVVAWVTPEKLMAGSFGDYNKRLLKHIGRIK